MANGHMTVDEREAFLADVHVGVLSVDEPGRGPLALPIWYRFVDGVVKYHRTMETYVNGLLDAGLRLVRLEEPEGEGALLAVHPEWRDERRRPPFLLMAADRPG